MFSFLLRMLPWEEPGGIRPVPRSWWRLMQEGTLLCKGRAGFVPWVPVLEGVTGEGEKQQ